ncbi:MAG: OmpA family protein [Rickettsiales bacterium]|jgi:outer membrane protein OmpA-like peptidoglycan-associated protein|nr:OmpA family protein [Rickettsiales bacterium]
MRKNHKIILFLLSIILLVSCSTDPYTGESKVSNTGKGSMIGAVGGAAIGALTAKKGNKGKAALIGAAAGGAVGAGAGYYLDRQESKLREELRSTGVSVVRDGDRINLIMPGNITFATGDATLTPSSKKVLNSVAKVINEFGKTFVQITGYTDNVGSLATNNTLSLQRATAVENYLRVRGVKSDRILVEGLGPKNPIASNNSAQGREQNRRVEISLTQPE